MRRKNESSTMASASWFGTESRTRPARISLGHFFFCEIQTKQTTFSYPSSKNQNFATVPYTSNKIQSSHCQRTMSSTSINHETGESTGEGRSPRFTNWVFFLMCSVITMKASVEVRNDMEDPNKAAQWAVISSAITFTVTALVVLLHLAPAYSSFFVGTKVEGLIVFVMAGFWTATVSIVTNTSNELGAVKSDTNQVYNGNLYYFSWAGCK